jgi:RNA polymerase sigma factor (sigma-70 family)
MAADLNVLLAHARWMETLAACLVKQAHDVEDVVQETWLAAIWHPPDSDRSPRPWLGEVLRNVVRMRSRSFLRRRHHEQAAALEPTAEQNTPHGLLERAQLHQLVVELVMGLPEPYRGTVLLRFFEGRTPAEISEQHGVPAGTVRWRLNESLRRLRIELDRRAGDRERWRALLAPLAGPVAGERRPVFTSPRTGMHPFVAAATLMTGLAGWGLWHLLPDSSDNPLTHPDPMPSTTQATKETDMRLKDNVTLAAALMVALPALAATAAEEAAMPSTEEAVALCTTVFERTYDCREQMADAYVVKAIDRERRALRKRALAEVLEKTVDMDKQCSAESVTKGLADYTPARVQELRNCTKASTCQAFSTCVIPVLRQGRPLRDWERR